MRPDERGKTDCSLHQCTCGSLEHAKNIDHLVCRKSLLATLRTAGHSSALQAGKRLRLKTQSGTFVHSN